MDTGDFTVVLPNSTIGFRYGNDYGDSTLKKKKKRATANLSHGIKFIRFRNSENDLNEIQEISPQSRNQGPSIRNKLDSLKDTTDKLLGLLDEIQTTCNNFSHIYDPLQLTQLKSSKFRKKSQAISTNSANQPEYGSGVKDLFVIKNSEDDCSIYKRLTRQCNCMNQDYNDFVIHFNETKYITSTNGEIIKNLKIVKRFLYMGGEHTRRALMFLNEGLSESKPTEMSQITQGCIHADICNVFEHHSIVAVCILWPCKYKIYEDGITQALAASLLFKLSLSDEGQQYLKFSYTITNDLIEVLKAKRLEYGNEILEYDTLESLNATLSIMHLTLKQHSNGMFYIDKSIEEKTLFNNDENAKKYELPIAMQAYGSSIDPKFVNFKRPRIVPIYTDWQTENMKYLSHTDYNNKCSASM